MPPNAAKKTWVVLVRSGSTSVFERRNGDGALTRIRDFTAVPDETGSLADLVQWLDAARRARSFERFMLVAPANDAGQLLSGLSRPTRALLAAPQADVLHQLPEAAAS